MTLFGEKVGVGGLIALSLTVFSALGVGGMMMSGEFPVGEMGALLVFATMLTPGLYLLPSIVAEHRDHRQQMPIFILNLLAGWTFVGWVGALVWSLTRERQ